MSFAFSRVTAVSVTELSWFWIAVQATAAPALGLLVAVPCWLRKEPILGNLAGTAVIFGSALASILHESVEIERITRGCLEAGYTCFATPSAFARYAIYAFIAMFEVFALFTASLSVEHKIRRRGDDPEWR